MSEEQVEPKKPRKWWRPKGYVDCDGEDIGPWETWARPQWYRTSPGGQSRRGRGRKPWVLTATKVRGRWRVQDDYEGWIGWGSDREDALTAWFNAARNGWDAAGTPPGLEPAA